jgi:hypothetical protein
MSSAALIKGEKSTPLTQPTMPSACIVAGMLITPRTRETPSARSRSRCFQSMPVSRMAMPTPAPSRPGTASVVDTRLVVAVALVFACFVACRVTARFGAMPITSVRAATAGTAAAGSMAESARTDR